MPIETHSVADFSAYRKLCLVWRIVLLLAPGICVGLAIWLFWPIAFAWLSAVCYGVSGILALATFVILCGASVSLPRHRAALLTEAKLFLGIALIAILIAGLFYRQ